MSCHAMKFFWGSASAPMLCKRSLFASKVGPESFLAFFQKRKRSKHVKHDETCMYWGTANPLRFTGHIPLCCLPTRTQNHTSWVVFNSGYSSFWKAVLRCNSLVRAFATSETIFVSLLMLRNVFKLTGEAMQSTVKSNTGNTWIIKRSWKLSQRQD